MRHFLLLPTFFLACMSFYASERQVQIPQRHSAQSHFFMHKSYRSLMPVFKRKNAKHYSSFKEKPTAGTLARHVHNNNIEAIEAILHKYPSLINEKTKGKKQTPLFYAQSKEAIEILLNYNPDITIKNKKGQMAKHVVKNPIAKKALLKRITKKNCTMPLCVIRQERLHSKQLHFECEHMTDCIIPLCVICQERPSSQQIHFKCNHMTVCTEDTSLFLEKTADCPLCNKPRISISEKECILIAQHQEEIFNQYETRLTEQATAEMIQHDLEEYEQQDSESD